MFYSDKYNPIVGTIDGNKQNISVYDSKTKTMKTIQTTPEKVDEFVNSRAEKLKKYDNHIFIGALLEGIVFTMDIASSAKNKLVSVVLGGLLSILTSVGLDYMVKRNIDKKITKEFINQNV